LAAGAANRSMFPLVVLCTIYFLIIIQREGNSHHALLTDSASETVWVEQGARNLHYPSLHHKATLLTISKLALVVSFTYYLLIVQCIIYTTDSNSTLTAGFLGVLIILLTYEFVHVGEVSSTERVATCSTLHTIMVIVFVPGHQTVSTDWLLTYGAGLVWLLVTLPTQGTIL